MQMMQELHVWCLFMMRGIMRLRACGLKSSESIKDRLSMPSMMQPSQRKTGRESRELAEASSRMTQQKLGDLGSASTLFIILQ
ncbi:hypothetical protein PO909_033955, partial [Leuciscus waleckii]